MAGKWFRVTTRVPGTGCSGGSGGISFRRAGERPGNTLCLVDVIRGGE